MGKRRLSRELSLQVLYQLELTNGPANHIIHIMNTIAGARVTEEVLTYARTIAAGTMRQQQAIDALIAQHANNWELERLSIIDKNIMRQAIYEMLYAEERIPPSVCINEALEIAKKFSASPSPAFINGILDKIIPPPTQEELT